MFVRCPPPSPSISSWGRRGRHRGGGDRDGETSRGWFKLIILNLSMLQNEKLALGQKKRERERERLREIERQTKRRRESYRQTER